MPDAPGQGNLCTQPTPAPVSSPWNVSSTTVGANNNDDIATTCGVAQTLFAGTGASLDLTLTGCIVPVELQSFSVDR